MSFTFQDVIGSFDTGALTEAMADRRLIHRPGASHVPPGALFCVEELEQLVLRDSMARKDFRVTVNGHIANLDGLGVIRDGRVQPLVVRQWARQGASIMLSDLHRYDPKFSALARDAERVLHDRVAIAAITSFSKLPALPVHYDPQDLIIVQVEGTKLWRFFGEPADCGVVAHPRVAAPKDVSATVLMQPGDILFIPAGLHHQCEAEAFSLHIGIVIKHATIQDFLNDLFGKHPSLHRPLRPLLGAQSVAQSAASLKEELMSLFSEADVADWLADWNGSRASVTTLGLREDVADKQEGIAALAVTMTPSLARGGRWKIGGLNFRPSAGARAVVSVLEAGPRAVPDVLERAGEAVGAQEALDGLDQLVGKGLVRISPQEQA